MSASPHEVAVPPPHVLSEPRAPVPVVAVQAETKDLATVRWTGAVFLTKAGFLLRVPQPVIASSILYFHKFYSLYSYQNHDKHIVASTCLFIACKAFEKQRRMRDIINVMTRVRFPSRQELDIVGQEFIQFREMITRCEQIVLRALSFDLFVELPYSFLLNFAHCLHTRFPGNRPQMRVLVQGPDGEREEVDDSKWMRDIVCVAWRFVNDSFRTRLVLDHSSAEIAATVLYMSSRLLGRQIRPRGWSARCFGIEKSKIDEIAGKIGEMYRNPVIRQ